jgi:hypothetical protein
MAYGAGAAAARAAAIAKAIKASGAIVRLEPDDFLTILSKSAKPLVVIAVGGFIKKRVSVLNCLQRPNFLYKIANLTTSFR